MKKWIKGSIVVAVILLLSISIYKTITKIKAKQTIKAAIGTLPVFDFQTLDSTSFTNSNLLKDKILVLIWFSTDCDHCQYEVKEFSKNPNSFSNAQILMVSGEPLENIRKFDEEYSVNTFSFIKLLHCNYQTFFNTFGPTTIPSIFIYSPDTKLLKQYSGETKLEAITKYLK